MPKATGPAESVAENSRGVAFTARGLSAGFSSSPHSQTLIFADLSFDVRPGEFVSIVGGSGVGKTTLLRTLGGLHPPTSESDIRCAGIPVNGPPERVVTVFQDYGASLLPWRTVERNVSLGLEGKARRTEIRRKVSEALSLVGLDRFTKYYPRQLSGGMQQRVQLARALVLEPLALLMDEPFGALDALTRASLQDAVLNIQRSRMMTVVFVTHDLDEAIYLSDRVLVMVGNPAVIALDLAVDLPRQRDQLKTKEDARYLQLRHSVYTAIHASSRPDTPDSP